MSPVRSAFNVLAVRMQQRPLCCRWQRVSPLIAAAPLPTNAQAHLVWLLTAVCCCLPLLLLLGAGSAEKVQELVDDAVTRGAKVCGAVDAAHQCPSSPHTHTPTRLNTPTQQSPTASEQQHASCTHNPVTSNVSHAQPGAAMFSTTGAVVLCTPPSPPKPSIPTWRAVCRVHLHGAGGGGREAARARPWPRLLLPPHRADGGEARDAHLVGGGVRPGGCGWCVWEEEMDRI